jgi:hypothetical protein
MQERLSEDFNLPVCADARCINSIVQRLVKLSPHKIVTRDTATTTWIYKRGNASWFLQSGSKRDARPTYMAAYDADEEF